MKLLKFLYLLGSLSGFLVPSAGDTLATITPCPSCPSTATIPLITVTEQLQNVSTCTPSTSWVSATSGSASSLVTIYPCSTYAWISTVLRAVGTNCTVTKTDQPVTFSHSSSNVTLFTTVSTSSGSSTLANAAATSVAKIGARQLSVVSEIRVTVVDYVAPFNRLGSLAIPGYSGSGLCLDCSPGNGTEIQVLDVIKCINGVCNEHVETWVSSLPSTSSLVASQTFSTSQNAPTNGVYTVTLAPPVFSTATVNIVPTTVSYAAATLVAPTNGLYEVVISIGNVITIEVFDAPAIYVFGSGFQVYTELGEYVITIVAAITITINIENAPVLYPINTVLRQGYPYVVNIPGVTYINGVPVTAPITQPGSIETAQATTNGVPATTASSGPAASSAAFGAPVSPLIVDGYIFTYAGCYGTSNAGGQTLVATSNSMTIESCLANCIPYDYAGVLGTQCYCATALSTDGGEGICDTPCPGDSSESCGHVASSIARRQVSQNQDLLLLYQNKGPVSSSSLTLPTSTASSIPSSSPAKTPTISSSTADLTPSLTTSTPTTSSTAGPRSSGTASLASSSLSVSAPSSSSTASATDISATTRSTDSSSTDSLSTTSGTDLSTTIQTTFSTVSTSSASLPIASTTSSVSSSIGVSSTDSSADLSSTISLASSVDSSMITTPASTSSSVVETSSSEAITSVVSSTDISSSSDLPSSSEVPSSSDVSSSSEAPSSSAVPSSSDVPSSTINPSGDVSSAISSAPSSDPSADSNGVVTSRMKRRKAKALERAWHEPGKVRRGGILRAPTEDSE